MSEITGFNKDSQGIFIVKDPTANVAYTLDWSEYLTSGVSITSAVVTIQTHSGDTSALAHPTSAANGSRQINRPKKTMSESLSLRETLQFPSSFVESSLRLRS